MTISLQLSEGFTGIVAIRREDVAQTRDSPMMHIINEG
jgi:hypothetical protein